MGQHQERPAADGLDGQFRNPVGAHNLARVGDRGGGHPRKRVGRRVIPVSSGVSTPIGHTHETPIPLSP